MPEAQRGPERPRRSRRPLSYANVVATLALAISLGAGTAYAAHHYLITSKKQIKPSVLHKLHGSRGPIGLSGATGATGQAGATGPTGVNSQIVEWNASVATPGASSSSPNTVTLATVGPFTISGYCFISSSHTEAGTYATTSQDGSALSAYDTNSDVIPFNAATGALQVNDDNASGTTSTSSPDFYGPYDGAFALSTANQSVVVTGFPNQGVYMQGSSGPACSFSGYLIKQGA